MKMLRIKLLEKLANRSLQSDHTTWIFNLGSSIEFCVENLFPTLNQDTPFNWNKASHKLTPKQHATIHP